MSNIANVLTTPGKDIVELLELSWRSIPANVDKLAGSIAAMKLTDYNTIIVSSTPIVLTWEPAI